MGPKDSKDCSPGEEQVVEFDFFSWGSYLIAEAECPFCKKVAEFSCLESWASPLRPLFYCEHAKSTGWLNGKRVIKFQRGMTMNSSIDPSGIWGNWFEQGTALQQSTALSNVAGMLLSLEVIPDPVGGYVIAYL